RGRTQQPCVANLGKGRDGDTAELPACNRYHIAEETPCLSRSDCSSYFCAGRTRSKHVLVFISAHGIWSIEFRTGCLYQRTNPCRTKYRHPSPELRMKHC